MHQFARIIKSINIACGDAAVLIRLAEQRLPLNNNCISALMNRLNCKLMRHRIEIRLNRAAML